MFSLLLSVQTISYQFDTQQHVEKILTNEILTKWCSKNILSQTKMLYLYLIYLLYILFLK